MTRNAEAVGLKEEQPNTPDATGTPPEYARFSREDLVRLLLQRDAELASVEHKKKYGLVWEEKEEEFDRQTVGKIPLLTRQKDLTVTGADGKPTHVLIKGDNYHALRALCFTHERAVDVIYIDPPYNTGNKDFKYNDKFVDREDGYRHSKWLSFMAKRLHLAKRLLKDTGAIFISIDDNEQAQLKLLCDSLLGEDNFHGNVTWHKRTKPINSGKARFGLQSNIEYVLVYTKKAKQDHAGFDLVSEGKRSYPQLHNGKRCRLKDILDSDEGRKKRDTMRFPVMGITPPQGQRWKYGQVALAQFEAEDRIAVVNGLPKLVTTPEDEDGSILRPFWSHLPIDQTGTAETGKAALSAIVGNEHGFDTVKPLELMAQLLVHFPKDVVVLDFFAGSGTTAHAVMHLNAKDEGTRKCILVTNDEGEFKDEHKNLLPGGICTHVTYPRLRKVIEGYTTPTGKAVEGLGENLAVFETEFVSETPTRAGKKALLTNAVDLLTLKEACFQEVKSSDKRWRQFTDGQGHHLVALFDEVAGDECAEAIATLQGDVKVYAFVYYEDDDIAESFAHLPNVTVMPMPEALLSAYRRTQLRTTKK